ncbi:HK97 gp10 family phage protein [Proteiniphilum acetatigenes]|uniref:HK97 gp10 family phage protein n=1 Tax=Proteiniphilum acetatigenes TaxID=294710 RepID=UPI00037558F2|nr:HK97 gp10 family phage protein [Proteiniphilum acetatigenes]
MSKKAGITPLFTKSDLNRWMKIFEDRVHAKTYTLLQAAGEMFVKYARESGKYIDHTGNLRSSIGYVIVENGSIEGDNFKIVQSGTDGKEGVEKARRLARTLANTHNTGMVLIGLAGMEYAVYVEAMESKDVITAANIKTEEWMRKAIQTQFDRA